VSQRTQALHEHGAGILGGTKGYGVGAADEGNVAIRVNHNFPGIVRNWSKAGNHDVEDEPNSCLLTRNQIARNLLMR
jgi:hypothetical protein